jgi:hypothetical protein
MHIGYFTYQENYNQVDVDNLRVAMLKAARERRVQVAAENGTVYKR